MLRLAVCLLTSSALVLSGCGSSTDKAGGRPHQHAVVLTLADGATDPDQLVGFAREAQRLSGGTIRIEFEDNWRLGQRTYETGLIGDVRAGKADLGWVGSRAWDTVGIRAFRPLGAPLLIDNYALERRVLESRLAGQLLEKLRPLGLVGLGILPSEFRRPLGVGRPLLRPGDFARRVIGVQQSEVADETMRALGAQSSWVPANRVDVRKFGGLEQRVSTINGFEYDVAETYLSSNVDLWPRPIVLFANEKAFKKLDSVQQQALKEAANNVSRQIAYDRQNDRVATDTLCRAGRLRFATAPRADLIALRQAVQSVYDRLEHDPATRTEMRQLERLKAATPSPPDSLPRCVRQPTAISRLSTPIDGVWRMVTRYGDIPNDPSITPENYGEYIFVFHRGRFAFTQHFKNACTWGYGTYAVTGRRVAWSFLDGGGIAPNGAYNKPGEHFVFGWSLYRGELVLTGSPAFNFRAKPWRRISSTPTRAFFDKQCLPPTAADVG